jgi:DNA-binding response OmpR family regulator
MKTILVVDDEPKIAALARDYLEHAGFTVITA